MIVPYAGSFVLPPCEVALAMLEFAIDEFIKSELHVVVAGDLAQLVFGAREAASSVLNAARPSMILGL